MAGVPGKNKLERGITILVDDQASGTARDLSGDLVPGSLSGLGFEYPSIDMTGVSNTVANALADRPTGAFSAKFYMNDLATTGAWTVFNSNTTKTGTVTVEIGSTGAAASTGDPVYGGEFVYLGGKVSVDGGKMVFDVTFEPLAGAAAPAWTTHA
jgi:hypothetical protein